MLNRSIMLRASKWLAAALLLGIGVAMAQSEPTLNQVYEAARAGRLEQAQTMVQQVLVGHPNSAKAHFVQAELAARQGQMSRAREALATAERLAPGLPFAQPEAVQALRSQLAARVAPPNVSAPLVRSINTGTPAPAPSSFPWGLALAVGGALIAFGIFMRSRTNSAGATPQAAYAGQGSVPSGLSGPQSFGMGGGMAQPYGAPAGTGLGGKLMGGLATGLAVGAGVMAAQAIGKSLMGNDAAHAADASPNNGYEPFAGNSDLGGQNFGVSDASSWDDGNALASSDDGGGWDS